jgi:hypothetical protein
MALNYRNLQWISFQDTTAQLLHTRTITLNKVEGLSINSHVLKLSSLHNGPESIKMAICLQNLLGNIF